ncbi:hypothetical protein G9U51_16850 [Calidifontibacter sp. DB0510]|uniref:DUF4157 domain-containing protein n=1 Tax=Metallococcus carri TaxID=1656884 RepID=A0A967EHZ0_9MICO|nr:hypothetical protein [Metallococcus carri]NHN57438.1 hypothetical protein [Metallococcus carri]NOP39166.1 hypothetical protein [Calidifontibacter sp. DB2511S]
MTDPRVRTWGAAQLRWKATANWLNGSTALGLLIARAGGARVRRGPRRLWLASGYRLGFPVASAFTVGNVVLTAGDWQQLERDRPLLLVHEEQHSWQYVWCLGLPFLPLYAAAAAWSKIVTGDLFSRNGFERRAGFAIGGYAPASPRAVFRPFLGAGS